MFGLFVEPEFRKSEINFDTRQDLHGLSVLHTRRKVPLLNRRLRAFIQAETQRADHRDTRRPAFLINGE